MRHNIRSTAFNATWSALRLPGSGWVSELLTGYLARSSRVTPRSGRNLQITKDRALGRRRPTFQAGPQQPETCTCCAAATCS